HEIPAYGAADAAVVHLEDFLVGAHHEVVVDADLAELVDDHGELLPVRLGEDAVEQRGLAGAEIAGEHGDGNFLCGLFGHAGTPLGRPYIGKSDDGRQRTEDGPPGGAACVYVRRPSSVLRPPISAFANSRTLWRIMSM